ncbi:hypothetical protein Tco_1101209 [Tanacetum coccineum]
MVEKIEAKLKIQEVLAVTSTRSCLEKCVTWAREVMEDEAEQFLLHTSIDMNPEGPWLAQRMGLQIPFLLKQTSYHTCDNISVRAGAWHLRCITIYQIATFPQPLTQKWPRFQVSKTATKVGVRKDANEFSKGIGAAEKLVLERVQAELAIKWEKDAEDANSLENLSGQADGCDSCKKNIFELIE